MEYKTANLALKFLFLSWSISSLAFACYLPIGSSKLLGSFEQINLFAAYSYLLICVSLIALGIVWGNPSYLRKEPNHVNHIENLLRTHVYERKYFAINSLLIYASTAFILLAGVAAFAKSGFTGDLESQRALHVSSATSGGLIDYLGQFGQTMATLVSVALPWSREVKLISKVILLTSIFLASTLISLSTGGRISILVCFVLPLLMNIIIKNNRVLFRRGKMLRNLFASFGILILCGLISSGFAVFQYYRTASYIDIYIGATIKPYEDFFAQLGVHGLANIIISYGASMIIGYLSNCFQFFPHFFEVYKPHPLLGAYQFNFISSRFPGFDWFSWKDEVEACYRYFGLFGNVWGSYVRDYVVDFGKIWTPLFSFYTGFFIGFLEQRAMRKLSFFILYVMMLSWLVMSPYYSLFLFRPFHIGIIFMSGWVLIELFSPQKVMAKD
jgi:hypothetical protein